jgi:hypothetical protein
MSAPDPNGDDGEITERVDQNGDAETAPVRASGTDPPPSNEHALAETEDGTEPPDPSERIAELETLTDVLRAENDRLRTDYARARKTSYRRTGAALVAIGVVAVVGGVILPDVRAVLFVTGAIGLFGGVMTWYLTPSRVVPIGVSESLYDAATTTLTGLRDELGLQPITVYIPVSDRTRGFVPRDREYEVPADATHAFLTDAPGSQGLTFAPSGERLAEEVDRIRTTRTPRRDRTDRGFARGALRAG